MDYYIMARILFIDEQTESPDVLEYTTFNGLQFATVTF
jgi:hypothetical protein